MNDNEIRIQAEIIFSHNMENHGFSFSPEGLFRAAFNDRGGLHKNWKLKMRLHQPTPAEHPLVTLTIGAHAGSTVNVYPGINCGSTCGPVEYDTGTVLTVSVTALPNYTGCTIGGTGCGASTTMSEARSCTVTCTKIAPDYTLGSGATVTIGSGAAATIQ